MKLQDMSIVALFAGLTAALSQIAIPIPFTPVPITLQPLAVLLAGAILGSRRGALSLIVYVLMGAVGLPVFAQGEGGLPVLLGPKGGYLFGFILAAFVIGLLTEKKRETSFFRLAGAMLLGMVIFYLTGWTQLKLVLGLSWGKSFMAGVLPFLPLDLLKVFFAAAIAAALRRSLSHAYPDWLSR